MERRQFLKAFLAVPFALAVPAAAREQVAQANVLLLDTVVAGFQYYRGKDIWRRLQAGDSLRLLREPENAYDEKAVEVFWQNEKLGYIPRADNAVIAQMMDRGTSLKARISRLSESRNPWERVAVRVVMEG